VVEGLMKFQELSSAGVRLYFVLLSQSRMTCHMIPLTDPYHGSPSC